MRRLSLVILLFVLGCTSAQYNLIPTPYKQKAKRFSSKGKNIIICEGKDGDLILFGYRDKSEIYLYSCIINKTDNKNLDLIPEKIKAFGLNKTKETKQLIIYSAQEYVNKKKNKAEQAQFSITLCSAINLMNAVRARSYSSNYSNISGNLGGSIFSRNEYRNDAIAFYSYGKGSDPQQSTKQELTSKSAAENQLYDSILLKKNRIPPNSYLEGLIVIDGKDSYHEKYVIIFPVGIDKHKIILKPAMVNN